MAPTIYHGTPFTPRAALQAVMPGRAACVSFWRPDDAEAVEAVCPAVMFRQWRLLRMDGSPAPRRRVVHPRGLDALFRVARAASVSAGAVGRHSRCARCPFSAERHPAPAMAFRAKQGGAALAYGWADRTALAAVRALRPRVPGLDRYGQRQGRRLRGMVAADGRDSSVSRQSTPADASHAGRPDRSGVRLHRQRRCQQRRAEWCAL